jgi:hypothetical protein
VFVAFARRRVGSQFTITGSSYADGCVASRKRSAARAFRSWDTGATLDDLREAVTGLEDVERTALRVLGGAHPLTEAIEHALRRARAALRARDTE